MGTMSDEDIWQELYAWFLDNLHHLNGYANTVAGGAPDIVTFNKDVAWNYNQDNMSR